MDYRSLSLLFYLQNLSIHTAEHFLCTFYSMVTFESVTSIWSSFSFAVLKVQLAADRINGVVLHHEDCFAPFSLPGSVVQSSSTHQILSFSSSYHGLHKKRRSTTSDWQFSWLLRHQVQVRQIIPLAVVDDVEPGAEEEGPGSLANLSAPQRRSWRENKLGERTETHTQLGVV